MTTLFRACVIGIAFLLMLFVWNWVWEKALITAFVIEFIIEPWVLAKINRTP